MKKIIALVIILGFSLFVFYTGWTQRKVPAGYCGIVQSKTSGIEEVPVIPGEYSWHWQFLLPSNAAVHQFKVQPFNTSTSISGRLASATTDSPVWNYKFTFSISLSYLPEAVVHLYKENYISNDEDFAVYLEQVADTLAQKAAAYYLQKLSENPEIKIESIDRSELIKAIDSYREFPELDVTIFALTDYTLPNPKLAYVTPVSSPQVTSNPVVEEAVEPAEEEKSADVLEDIL